MESGEMTLQQVKRAKVEKRWQEKRDADQARIDEHVEPLGKLKGVFATIVIDPPWDFGDKGDGNLFRRERPTYQTQTIDEIKKITGPDGNAPIQALAGKDCHLYLWIPNRTLPKGFALLEEWGFRYITCLTWCKPSIGMGNYFRGSTEQVLFGVRGSQPLLRKDVGTWFSAKRGEHSAKPKEFFSLVEECSPGPYLELFAREKRKGWESWPEEV